MDAIPYFKFLTFNLPISGCQTLKLNDASSSVMFQFSIFLLWFEFISKCDFCAGLTDANSSQIYTDLSGPVVFRRSCCLNVFHQHLNSGLTQLFSSLPEYKHYQIISSLKVSCLIINLGKTYKINKWHLWLIDIMFIHNLYPQTLLHKFGYYSGATLLALSS